MVPEPTGWRTTVRCVKDSFARQLSHSTHPSPEVISSGPQLPIPEAGAPSLRGAPTCDAPGDSERTAQAWRPRVCPMRRRWGRGWHSGWLPTASSLGLPVGLDKGHFLGGAGNVPSMPRFVVHRDFLPLQQQRGAPTRTPELEEGHSLYPWTLSGCSSAWPVADPPPPLGRVRSCRRVLAPRRLLPGAHSASGLFFISEVCDRLSLSWLFPPSASNRWSSIR